MSLDSLHFGRPSSMIDGWSFFERGELRSTNDAAAGLPAWSAVRADTQSAGRGRHDRVWVSDRGGLWLSAVVPVGPPEQGWGALPLAAGLAMCETLAGMGVGSLRLRWPNDVMLGTRKLAGVLIDQFQPGTAVIGLGLNVRNQPGAVVPALRGQVACLEEFLSPVPSLGELARRILGGVRGVVEVMLENGFAGLVPRVNTWWQAGMCVDIETAEGRTEGVFLGVDPTGRLRVGTPAGEVRHLAAHQVIRLRELIGDSS